MSVEPSHRSDEKLRVASLTTVYPRPGNEKFGLFIQARLRKLAELASVRVVVPVAAVAYGNPGRRLPDLSSIPETATDGNLTVDYPRWVYPPLAGWAHSYWLARFAGRAFDRIRPRFPFDIIDAHFGHPEAGAARLLARRFGVPFAVTLRGNETMHAEHPGKRERMARAFEEASAVICVSRPLGEFAVSLGARPDRVAVIPNGIDERVFQPRPREEWRHKIGMDGGERHIVSAGYLIERKGHHRIVETLPRLRAEGRRVRLWIVGGPGPEGDYSGEIRRRVDELGVGDSVTFVPPVEPEELSGYMSAGDVFCLATSREGWPNVVNEALACGAPVVATRVGGVPDMITSDDVGLVVEPGDTPALGEALARVLDTEWDRERIALHGSRRGWSQVAVEVEATLRKAVEEAKGR